MLVLILWALSKSWIMLDFCRKFSGVSTKVVKFNDRNKVLWSVYSLLEYLACVLSTGQLCLTTPQEIRIAHTCTCSDVLWCVHLLFSTLLRASGAAGLNTSMNTRGGQKMYYFFNYFHCFTPFFFDLWMCVSLDNNCQNGCNSRIKWSFTAAERMDSNYGE